MAVTVLEPVCGSQSIWTVLEPVCGSQSIWTVLEPGYGSQSVCALVRDQIFDTDCGTGLDT